MEATELIRSLCERLGIGYEPDDNGGSCSFEADGLLVMINNLRNLDQIAIVGDLGDPPPEKLETLYKMMLEANYMLISTGGATIGLDSENGHFAIYQTLPCKALDAEEFYSITDRFVSTLEAWTKIIRDFRAVIPSVKHAEETARNGLPNSGFMKV